MSTAASYQPPPAAMPNLRWTAHPLFPVPTEQDIRDILALPAGAEKLAHIYALRENAILDARADPFHYEPEPEHWLAADKLLAEEDAHGRVLFLMLLGGNRSGKSMFAARRMMESAVGHKHCKLLCIAENFESSIETQQKYLWHYLPNELKALNGRQSKKFYIKYSSHHGFSDQLLALPNGAKFMFKTYQQDPGDLEGQMFGIPGTTVVAVWPDENLRVNWWLMLQRRLRFQQAQLIWSYTPVTGMTATIKEAVGDAPVTRVSRLAELLPDRVNVPGLPVGHMPFIQIPATTRGRVIYFWSEFNRFGDGQRTFYDAVKDDCRGKGGKPRSPEYIARIAYGHTRDTVGRPFPKFGEWNIVAPEHLPTEGTDYMFVDPAGARNFAALWVRVTPDDRYYVMADWPDAANHGEWAIPNLDGTGDAVGKLYKAGPAQNSLGLGTSQLKRVWRAVEAELGLDVAARFIDPRAGRNPQAQEHGGTCLVDQFALAEEDEPGMDFVPASGTDQETRIAAVNKLLHWDDGQPLDMVANCPRLYVSAAAQQVIGTFTHWPGPAGGEKHAWKDFADLLGYLVMADLQYLDPKREVSYV